MTVGLEEEGPYDIVIVNGNVPKIPRELLHQLDGDQGRMLFFLQQPNTGSQNCYIIRKNEEVVRDERLSRFQFTPIHGRFGWDEMGDLQEQYDRARKTRRSDRNALEKIKLRTPYPLAKAFLTAHNTGEVMDRHVKVVRAYEALLKYFAFVSMSLFDQLGMKDDGVAELVHKIGQRPGLGDWYQLLLKTNQLADETHEIRDAINKDLTSRIRFPSVVAAMTMLDESTGQAEQAGKGKVTLSRLFERVVAYRNRSEATHGPQRGERELCSQCDLLLAAMRDLLLKSRLCNRYRLTVFEEVSLEHFGLEIGLLEFSGCEPDKKTWRREELTLDGSQLRPTSGFLYLCRDGAELLSVTPWMVWCEGQRGEDLFLYNQDGKQFITYHNNNVFPPDWEQQRIGDVLERHEPSVQTVEIDPHRQEEFRRLMGIVVADKRISREEMAELRRELPRMGIVGDADEVEPFVREIVRESYPGVYFDG